jgi:ABC-type transporter Mla subunit MlaD
MNRAASDFKIGLFILAAAAVLAAGLLALGGARFFENTVTAETYVAGNVNDLDVGAPVTLRGVRVGRVTVIQFTWGPQGSPGYVRIQFDVLARTFPVRGKALATLVHNQVKQGLRARVETEGLIGSTLLALEYVNPNEYPPPSLPRPPQHLYIPSAPSQFNQMLTSMERSLRKLSQLDLEKLSAALHQVLLAADNLLDHINAVNFEQVGTNVNGLVTELRGLGAKSHQTIENLNRTVNQMDLAKLSGDADTLLLRLQATTHHLEVLLANVNAGSLNETIASVQRASVELEQVLHELKQYPSGFLFGSPPPPAKGIVPRN